MVEIEFPLEGDNHSQVSIYNTQKINQLQTHSKAVLP